MQIDENEVDTYVTKTDYSKETGLPVRQITRLNGKLHSPPDGSPSIVRFMDGKPATFEWHDQNLSHRLDGPSSIRLDPVSGKKLLEIFEIKGQPRPPEDGAYRVWYDAEGKVLREAYAATEDYATPDSIAFERNKLELE